MPTATTTKGKTILLTGPNNFLGKLVLKRLGKVSGIKRILTLGDGAAVRGKKIKHIRINPTNRKIIDHLKKEKVDTIVHLGPAPNPGRDETIFERNVIGTMTLLGAAADVGVKHILIRSNYSIYGARHNNPNFIAETKKVRFSPKRHFVRDVAEIERYANEFLKYSSDVTLTILRLAPVVGPNSDAAFMQYLRMDPCPILLGFDPLIQLLHENDAADAIIAAVKARFHGAVNLAPDGVAPLLKIMRYLGKTMLTVPYFPLKTSERVVGKLRSLPFDAGFLRFSTCLENDRMKDKLKFTPELSSGETLGALKKEF